jgi:hypothetical protein
MEVTLQQDEIKTSFCATGHINNLWNHPFSCIKDRQETLSRLRNLLDEIKRSTSVLSETRKHARLQRAVEEVGYTNSRFRAAKTLCSYHYMR